MNSKFFFKIINILFFWLYNIQKKANIQRQIICLMLYHQHLKPWLLIYVLATIFLSLSCIGTLVIMILNNINGFSLSKTIFSNCPSYTNIKLNMSMLIALQICFVTSCINVVFSLGQCGIGIWQFFLFTKWSKDNGQNQPKPFQSLTRKVMIVLYILNATGFLTLIPIVGWFGTLFIEISNCRGTQNKSDIYTLPSAVAGSCLIFQICSFCLLLKLFYHFNQDQNESSAQNDESIKQRHHIKDLQFQTAQAQLERRNRQRKQLEQLKKRILQSKNQQNYFKNTMENQIYNSHSTNGSPNGIRDGLLLKNSPQDHISGCDQNYSIDRKQIRRKKKKNKINYPFYNQQYPLDSINQNGNQSFTPFNQVPLNSIDNSPNQITQQQKNLMRMIPRNEYKKKRRRNRNRPNDIIFEDFDQDNMNSIKNYQSKKRKKNVEQFICEEEQKNTEKQIQKLRNIIETISPKSTKSQEFHIFTTMYHHMMYQIKKRKKMVSNSERRCIKRHLLGIKSKIVQFDAKNYQIQQTILKVEPNDQSPYKSNNSQKQPGSDTKLQAAEQNISNPQNNQGELTNQFNLQIAPPTVPKIRHLKTAAQIWQQGFLEGKKAQYYNPIKNYVEQGEQYEERLKKILEFEQIGLKKTDQFDPFEPIPGKQKTGQIKEKLYLHKNKPRMSRVQTDDPLEEYQDRPDPLKDMAFEDDWQIQRGYFVKDQTIGQNSGKSEKKGLFDGFLNTAQPKRINRKECGLVELIRGKHPISFL